MNERLLSLFPGVSVLCAAKERQTLPMQEQGLRATAGPAQCRCARSEPEAQSGPGIPAGRPGQLATHLHEEGSPPESFKQGGDQAACGEDRKPGAVRGLLQSPGMRQQGPGGWNTERAWLTGCGI